MRREREKNDDANGYGDEVDVTCPKSILGWWRGWEGVDLSGVGRGGNLRCKIMKSTLPWPGDGGKGFSLPLKMSQVSLGIGGWGGVRG